MVQTNYLKSFQTQSQIICPLTLLKLVDYIDLAMSSEVPAVRLSTYLSTLPSTDNLVFFIGAMSHGSDNWVDEIIDDKICISDYSLSAAATCSKLTTSMEELWGVL